MGAWKMGGEGAPARGDSDPSHHGSQRKRDAFAEPYLLLSDLDGLNMILLDLISKASSAWEKNGISLLGCEAEPQDLNPEGLSGSGTEDMEGADYPEKGRAPFLTEGLFEFSQVQKAVAHLKADDLSGFGMEAWRISPAIVKNETVLSDLFQALSRSDLFDKHPILEQPFAIQLEAHLLEDDIEVGR